MSDQTIRVITYDLIEDSSNISESGKKTGFSPKIDYFGDHNQSEDFELKDIQPKKGVFREHDISIEQFEQEMKGLLDVVDRLFSKSHQQAKSTSGMQLDEVELSVEISSEGKLSIFGSGATVGGKGAIKLKFKRTD